MLHRITAVQKVDAIKNFGIVPIYATTERVARKHVEDEKIITVRKFTHVRFREYELDCSSETRRKNYGK